MAITNNVISFRSNLSIDTNGMIKLEVPTEKRGIRTLNLSSVAVKLVKLTDAEETVYNWLVDGLETGKVFPVDITLPELKTLGEIKAKTDALYNAPKVKTETRIDKTNKVVYQEITSRATSSGLDATEVKVNSLDRAIKQMSKQYTYLQYDIPSVLDGECPNPSWILWRYGFRMTKSCWALPIENMEKTEIAELLAHWDKYPTVKVRIAKFDKDEMEKIRGWAQEELRTALVEIHTSFMEALAKADENFQEIMQTEGATPRQIELADNKHDSDIRKAIRLAAVRLDSLVKSAELYDQTENVQDLLKMNREAIVMQRDTFNLLMRQKGGKKVEVKV